MSAPTNSGVPGHVSGSMITFNPTPNSQQRMRPPTRSSTELPMSRSHSRCPTKLQSADQHCVRSSLNPGPLAGRGTETTEVHPSKGRRHLVDQHILSTNWEHWFRAAWRSVPRCDSDTTYRGGMCAVWAVAGRRRPCAPSPLLRGVSQPQHVLFFLSAPLFLF